MHFTKEDLERIIHWATYRTARSLGIIGDDEEFCPEDAVEIIFQLKGHKDALVELADAYQAWYGFHLDIYKAGKSGNLSNDERVTLDRLIFRREEAKRALLAITPV